MAHGPKGSAVVVEIKRQTIHRLVIDLTPEEASKIVDNDWDKTREPTAPGKVLLQALIGIGLTPTSKAAR